MAKDLEAREKSALAELERLGLTVTLNEPPAAVEEDPLLGISAGFRPGCVAAAIYSTVGQKRLFTGISACQVLQDVKGWLDWQARLKEDAPGKWEIANGPVAFPVMQRAGSEAVAHTSVARAATTTRVSSESPESARRTSRWTTIAACQRHTGARSVSPIPSRSPVS